MDLYAQRASILNPHIRGHGIEIGAGPNPHPVGPSVTVEHADIRTQEELGTYFGATTTLAPRPWREIRECFPLGADFVIAHHVLEHLPDPIGCLVEWCSALRTGGVMVASVPAQDFCPDKGRLLPPISHLIRDYIFNRDGRDFESKEHVLSFLLGWIENSPALKGLSPHAAAELILSESRRDGHDFHWHAMTAALFRDIVLASAYFCRCSVEFLIDPADWTSGLDILAAFRLRPDTARNNPLHTEIERIKAELVSALGMFPPSASPDG